MVNLASTLCQGLCCIRCHLCRQVSILRARALHYRRQCESFDSLPVILNTTPNPKPASFPSTIPIIARCNFLSTSPPLKPLKLLLRLIPVSTSSTRPGKSTSKLPQPASEAMSALMRRRPFCSGSCTRACGSCLNGQPAPGFHDTLSTRWSHHTQRSPCPSGCPSPSI